MVHPPISARIRPALLSLAIAAQLGSSAHAETQLQLSAGAFFSSGDFDDLERTDVTVAPFSLRIRNGPWSLRATVPYVSLRGPGDVTIAVDDDSGGGGGSNSGTESSGRSGSGSGSGSSSASGSGSGSGSSSGSGSGRSGSGSAAVPSPAPLPTTPMTLMDQSASGIGDTSLSATYSFEQLASSSAYLDLTGRVRLPTGDEDKGLGVGATDYALLGELGWENATGSSYLSVGRRFLGDTADEQRKDGWQLGAGAWIDATDSIVLGAFYERRDASVGDGEDLSEAGVYVTKALSDSLKIELSGSAGLSNANAEYEVGVTLIWRSLDRAR